MPVDRAILAVVALSGLCSIGLTACELLFPPTRLGPGTGDAGVDAGVDSSTRPSDAGAEGAVVAEADGPFCPADAGSMVLLRWTSDGVDAAVLGLYSANANVGLVTGTSFSPPNSLLVTLLGAPNAAGYGVHFLPLVHAPTRPNSRSTRLRSTSS